MNSKNTLPVSEARKKLFEIIARAQKPDNYFVLTLNGKPKAVLMSAGDFESWQETLAVYQDFPDLEKDIKEAQIAYQTGAYKEFDTIEDLLAKEGFILADKGDYKYEVQSKNTAKGGKRNRKIRRKK